MRPFVFFSHASADYEWCDRLANDARAAGLEPYMAEHDRQPGKPVVAKVKAAIERSDLVVVLLTHNSSSFVDQEVGFATHADKLILPLVQRGLPPERLAMLLGLEYIEFDFDDPNADRVPFLAELSAFAARHEAPAPAQGADTSLVPLVLVVALLVLVALPDK